ncbi:MAG: pyrroline-5-carboxylate reductase [Treponema sp.]|nr:pyrroline-5-carboxylate reductase [Treponema sp.]
MTEKIDVNVACIGCGVMGGALMRAVAKVVEPKKITVSAKTFDEALAFSKEIGCNAVVSNTEATKGAKFVFVAVKPAFVDEVLRDIDPALSDDAVVVSMAAGVKLETIANALVRKRTLVRIMPNMPAAVGEAMIALCASPGASEDDVATAQALLSAAGKVERVDEKQMDCVTAVSGSGPAFVFMFIEAMADAAVKLGMPRAQAYTYAAQTLKGSAEMVLRTGRHPGALKDAVCSPSGTTIEGVATLERNGFRDSVIEAVTAAYERSVELGND